MTKQDFYTKLESYAKLFNAFFIDKAIDTQGIGLDHICYTCSDSAEFEQIRSWFEMSDVIYQSIISKRRIAYIGLREPIISTFTPIFFLELSDQKPDNSQTSGCNHIEPYPQDISYDEMLFRFQNLELDIKENIKPHHSTHDISVPNNLKIRLTRERLIDKIYREEMKMVSMGN
jgi:predicted metalloenzyme YecM